MNKSNSSLWSEIYSSMIFPMILSSLYVLFICSFNLSFIEKIIVVVFLLVAITIFMLEKHWDRRNNEDIMILRRLILLVVGSAALFLASYQDNLDKNDYGIIPWFIPSMLFIIMSVLFVSFRRARRADYSCAYHIEVSRLLVYLITAACAWQYIIHFGSLYVWVPAAISLFSIFAWRNNASKDYDQYFLVVVSVANIIAVLVSGVYQLGWSFFTKIINNIFSPGNLWLAEALLVCLVAALIILSVVKIVSKIKRNKAEKLAAKKAEEDQAKNLAENQKILEQLKAIKEKIVSGEGNNWKNILSIAKYFNLDIDRMPEVCEKIHLAPLADLVTVSDIKKQIVWSNDFSLAIRVIEKIVARTYVDEKIKAHIDQINVFMEFLKPYDKFVGYTEIKSELRNNCPTVLSLNSSLAVSEKN